MKYVKLFGAFLSVFAFLFVFQAMAAEKGNLSITLDTPTLVSGKLLPAGEYSVKWMAENPGGEVSFFEQGKQIADVRCKILDRGTKVENNEVETTLGKDGKRALQEIRLRGKTLALVFS